MEANRRLPSSELKQRISSVLDIAPEDLEAADSRLSSDLREWMDERPQLISVLRSLKASPEADMLIQRLSRFLYRPYPPQTPPGLAAGPGTHRPAVAAGRRPCWLEKGRALLLAPRA